MLLVLVICFAAVAAELRRMTTDDQPAPALPPSLVLLPNGMPFEAPPGSADRQLIDWLNAPDPGERVVDLGRKQFQPNSVVATVQFSRRIDKLASILATFDNIDVKVTPLAGTCAHSLCRHVASRRASWIAEALRRGGLPSYRIDAGPDDQTASRMPGPDPGEGGDLALIVRKQS